MAITAASLTSGNADNNASSYDTASITPTANRLVLAAVVNRDSTLTVVPTLSGCGLTWVEIDTQPYTATDGRRITLFRAMGATPSAGVLTIDTAGDNQTGCMWSVAEFAGVDTSGTNGSGAVVQSAKSEGLLAASLAVTLAAFGSANNATYGCFGHNNDNATTPGTDFTEIHDVVTAGEGHALQTEWKTANDTSVDASWSGSVDSGGIAVEIKAEVASSGGNNRRLLLGVG